MAVIGLERIRQLARAGLPFNPLSGDEITGANLNRLSQAMTTFGWRDPRFVAQEDVDRLGWSIDAESRAVELFHRSQNGAGVTVRLFNAENVQGIPSLSTFLAMPEEDLQKLQVPGDADAITIRVANRRVEQVPDLATSQDGSKERDGTLAAAAGDSGRFVVAAPYWLDDMHNAAGIAMAKELNDLVRRTGLARDPQAIERLLEGRERAALYELRVMTEEEHLRDSDYLRNPAEPSSLVGGELVRDKEGGYRPRAGGSAVLVDEGECLTVKSRSPLAYQAAIELAKSKGWTAIELSGKGKMLSDAWLEAKLAGIEVVNYSPTLEDEKRLAESLAQLNAEKASQEADKALAKGNAVGESEVANTAAPTPSVGREVSSGEIVEVRPYVDADGHQKTATVIYTITQEGVRDQQFDNAEDAAKAFHAAPSKNLPAVMRSAVRAEGQVDTGVMVAGTTKLSGRGKYAKSADPALDREFSAAIDVLTDKAKEAPVKPKGEKGEQGAGQYSGRILRIEGDYVIQKIGRNATDVKRHPIGKLDRVPVVGDVVDIAVDKQGKATVLGGGQELGR